MTETFITFSAAIEEMAPADLLLWRAGWNPISFLTGVFGRSGLSPPWPGSVLRVHPPEW